MTELREEYAIKMAKIRSMTVQDITAYANRGNSSSISMNELKILAKHLTLPYSNKSKEDLVKEIKDFITQNDELVARRIGTDDGTVASSVAHKPDPNTFPR